MDAVGPDPRDPEGGVGPGSADPAASDPSVSEPSSAADEGPTTEVVPAASATDSPPPVPVDTDAAVATEVVEPPPVQIATVDRPAGPRRVKGPVAALVAIIGAVAIGAVAYVGYSLNQDLASTRTTLATTQDDLGSTRTTVDETTAKVATTKRDLATATKQQADLDAQVTDLSAQVATQTECVVLQRAALAELVRISELQTQNFNRTAVGSAWDTAEKRRADGITVALDEFYKAYSAAFQGSTGTAKGHADKGRDAQAKIADAEQRLVAELKLVDSKAGEIQTAIDALETRLKTTEATCAGVAP